jgi:hypothetical protein
MSEDFNAQVAAELARIEALPAGEQPEAYRAVQAMLERILEQTEGK